MIWFVIAGSIAAGFFIFFVTLALGFGIGHTVGHWKGLRELTPERRTQATLEMATLKALFDSLEAIKLTTQRPIPPNVWKKLIKLTHPDMHRGSKLSTEMTVWLNTHRPEGS